MTEVVIEYIKMIFIYFLGIQWGSVLLFLILEWALVDYYRWGTFKGPTSIFQKILNIIMAIAMGSGYFLYSKFEKYNWITRKIVYANQSSDTWSLMYYCLLFDHDITRMDFLISN